MERIGLESLIVHAVEHIFFIALVVHHGELRRIEEAAGVQPVHRNEIAPLLAAVGEIEAAVGRAESCRRTVVTLPCGVVTPRPERVVTSITRLVLSPYSAGGAPSITSSDWTESSGNLVGEDLALLVGDRLAVDGEGIFGVIAEAVKQAVGIGGDSRRGQRHQRTDATTMRFRAGACRKARDRRRCGTWNRFRPGRRRLRR